MIVRLFFLCILIFTFGCGTGSPSMPVIDDNPPVEGGFLEIANNPNANKSQKHLVSLLKDLVGEDDNELAFQKLQEIKEINFTDKGIVDISALQGLKKIEKLVLVSNYIEDLVPLQNLLELQELNLSDNSIVNVDSIRNLSKLKQLDISANQIENVNSFENLLNLGFLNLGYNPLNYITGIQNINTLEKLNLYYIGDVKVGENILNLTKLKELYVNIYNQSNFTELENALIQNQSIEILWLIYDSKVSLSGLHNIKSLKKLSIIHDNYYTDSVPSTIDLSQFSEFVNLEELYTSNLEVTGKASLEDLKKPHLNDSGETISLKITIYKE